MCLSFVWFSVMLWLFGVLLVVVGCVWVVGFGGYDLVCALVLFVVLCLEFGVLHLVGRLVWVC